MTNQEIQVTCSAPVNIAVIKYWGKRDSKLLLPINSSLSVTLNQDDLKSTTSIKTCSDGFDRIWLNGKEQDVMSKRLQNVINAARSIRRELEVERGLPKISDRPLWINSINNFPTAAGLASSASGFACLTFALAKLYEIDQDYSQLSKLARLGSGSACRSLFGGYVSWEMGELDDGSDSLAMQVAPKLHWDLEVLILVVSDSKKETGSTVGMQQTVETSTLLKERIKIVPERMSQMKSAILSRNFDEFCELTMKDSNQFHSVCLDTYPPVFYMNDISKGIVQFVHCYNNLFLKDGKTGYRCCYTFDAGPNAVLYILPEYVPEVLASLNEIFPPANPNNEYFGRASKFLGGKSLKVNMNPYPTGSLKRIISTSVGDGPRLLANDFKDGVSLFDSNGNPIFE